MRLLLCSLLVLCTGCMSLSGQGRRSNVKLNILGNTVEWSWSVEQKKAGS